MKIVLLIATALSLTTAAPSAVRQQKAPTEEEEKPQPILILVDERKQPNGGSYSFRVETENGIMLQEVGTPGSAGQTNVEGQYRYTLEDGSIAEVKYVADELGFQVDSPLIPKAPEFPHPIPQFVLDQIAFAEEQHRLLALQLQEEAKLKEELEAQETKVQPETKLQGETEKQTETVEM